MVMLCVCVCVCVTQKEKKKVARVQDPSSRGLGGGTTQPDRGAPEAWASGLTTAANPSLAAQSR